MGVNMRVACCPPAQLRQQQACKFYGLEANSNEGAILKNGSLSRVQATSCAHAHTLRAGWKCYGKFYRPAKFVAVGAYEVEGRGTVKAVFLKNLSDMVDEHGLRNDAGEGLL